MKRTSLDGRVRKSQEPTKSVTWETNKFAEQELKPASPPKSSPWRRIASSSTGGSEDFPALPLTKTGTGRTEDSFTDDKAEDNCDPEAKQSPPNFSQSPRKCASVEDATQPGEGLEDPFIQDRRSLVGEEDEQHALAPSSEKKGQDSRGLGSHANGDVFPEISQDKISPRAHKNPKISDVSKASNDSRKLFEAAAARATQNLIHYSIGADVHIHVESIVYKVHRDVLVSHSAWFRRNLESPHRDGTPVDIYLPFASGAVGPCLAYMYTNRIDVCERNENMPLCTIHLPRCVLGYCGAVTFQMSGLSSHILSIVETTAGVYADYFASHPVMRELELKQSHSFVFHLINALDIIHSETYYELVRPLRLALAGVFDGVLPFLIQQSTFLTLIGCSAWKKHSLSILADMMEYRRLAGYSQHPGGFLPSSEAAFDALFEGLAAKDQQDGDQMDVQEEDLYSPGY